MCHRNGLGDHVQQKFHESRENVYIEYLGRQIQVDSEGTWN